MSGIETAVEVRPPKGRYVHHYGKEVEAVYPFPEDLGRRAVKVTRAGYGDNLIDPDTFRGGLVPLIKSINERLRVGFIANRIGFECVKCEAGCGLGQENERRAPEGLDPRSFFIQAGVDRARPEEAERPDQPILMAHIRCFDALESETADNYDRYARAQVDKLPEDMQFDARCQETMASIARATFSLFEAGLVQLEQVRF